MKLNLSAVAALIACLGLFCTQSANAQRQREYQTANNAAYSASASLASYNSCDGGCESGCGCDSGCDSGGCDSGCDSGCCSDGSCGRGSRGGSGLDLDLGPGLLERPGQFFAGAEYIYARASFSEALAFVLTDANAPQGGQDFVEYDFDYSSSYRFYGGYRFCDCGAELVFNFGRYQSDADFSVTDTATTTINAPYETTATIGAGGTLSGDLNVDIKSYDIGISKTIPLGSPLSNCGGCNDSCCGDGGCDCGDSCGSDCWCPAWDITWSAALRYADVGWSRGQIGRRADGRDMASSLGRLNFEGAGARVGLMGRRYIGRKGLASIYAKGDISLLVGDMDISVYTQNLDNADPAVRSHGNSARRVIPVTEIEVGATAHLGDHINISSGYFIAAWHDLGIRDSYDFNGAFQLSHYDDANILGFDGFFSRVEFSY